MENMVANPTQTHEDYQNFIASFKETLKQLFVNNETDEVYDYSGRFPDIWWNKIMSHAPLSVSVPSVYGGRGAIVKECLGVLEAASYRSLPLSLMFGINIALFLEPVAKYAQDSIKGEIFRRVISEKNTGGLMITEPSYGSDALNMKASCVKNGDQYHIKGTKHWQGLTGMADYWLVACRSISSDEKLSRDIELFVCEDRIAEQKIHVEEYFDNIGLRSIPYGINNIDVKVPEANKLIPETTGIKMLMDILFRSRMQFPGMAMGFIRRIMDESIQYCNSRIVGKCSLLEYDQVKFQIAQIQSAYTACSAMCHRSAQISSIDQDVSSNGLQANSIKALITDYMQSSAQTMTQLFGSGGFKKQNFGGRGIMDSRAFRIFEGPNEILYTQIAEIMLKKMFRAKEMNLYNYLKTDELSSMASEHFKEQLDFTTDRGISQRKTIELGKIISRVIIAEYVLKMGNDGFRKDLIDNCINHFKIEISSIKKSFEHENLTVPIEDYADGGVWSSFI